MRATDTLAPLVRPSARPAPSPYLFEWDAADLTVAARTGQAPTFTRATAGSYLDSRGHVRVAPYGMPRFTWVPRARRVGLLLEGAVTNCVSSNGLEAANWGVDEGALVRTPETWAGVPMMRIRGTGRTTRSIGVVRESADGAVSISFCVKRGRHESPLARVDIYDTSGGGYRFTATVTGWDAATGAPVVAVTPGRGEFIGAEPLADGVFRVLCRTGVCTAGANHFVFVMPTDFAPGPEGEVVVGGLQVEDAPTPSSIVFSASTARATRAAERLTYPIGWRPRDLTIYAEWARPWWVGLLPAGGYHTLVSVGHEVAMLYDGGAGHIAGYAIGDPGGSGATLLYPAGEPGEVVRAAARASDVATDTIAQLELEGGATTEGGRAGPRASYQVAALGLGGHAGGVPGYEFGGVVFSARVAAGARSLSRMRGGY